ncbi:hypothetical protein [Nocardia carnea]|uniref:hypothetical protein n=1 Tax=Nocardia carnea TaxID=37328 RepID=UPI0024552CC0|nr:hypothetical protein [Nocardia carnea]
MHGDDALLSMFERGELDELSHRDHLRVVFAKTRQANEEEAVEFTRRGLRTLTERLGMPEKYHETLTVAWARIVSALTAASPAVDFAAFLDTHPDLASTSFVEKYYTRQLLFSPAARDRFVAPDLRDLP